ncbi:MAG: DUF3310 domain-containing protein [Candidatus Peribacteraceae bacterium]|nr:DUF3310 domain-containing protein [Candidatus Peribacteraceae bacterium]
MNSIVNGQLAEDIEEMLVDDAFEDMDEDTQSNIMTDDILSEGFSLGDLAKAKDNLEVVVGRRQFEDAVGKVAENAADLVNHPPHYNKHPSGIECIEITEHLTGNVSNAWKYIWRAGLKFDDEEDKEKGVWYTNREINRNTNAMYDLGVGDFKEAYGMMSRVIETEPNEHKRNAFNGIFLYCIDANPLYLEDILDEIKKI